MRNDLEQRVAGLVEEIEDEAAVERQRTGRQVLGVKAILAQDQQYRPTYRDRSPAPLFLAASCGTRRSYRSSGSYGRLGPRRLWTIRSSRGMLCQTPGNLPPQGRLPHNVKGRLGFRYEVEDRRSGMMELAGSAAVLGTRPRGNPDRSLP